MPILRTSGAVPQSPIYTFPSSADIKNEWSWTSIPDTHIQVACWEYVAFVALLLNRASGRGMGPRAEKKIPPPPQQGRISYTLNFTLNRKDCQLQGDLCSVWRGWFVQPTNNDSTEEDKNLRNLGGPGPSSGSACPVICTSFPPLPLVDVASQPQHMLEMHWISNVT